MNPNLEAIAPETGFAAPSESTDLRYYLDLLWQKLPVLLSFVVAGLVLGLYRAWVAPPIYRSDLLMQVEEKTGNAFSAVDPATAFYMMSARGNSEQEIVRSRSVIASAVKKLRLNVQASPLYWGEFGQAYARRHSGPDLAPPPFPGVARYAWGGEDILVDRFEVPTGWEGRWFSLRALGDGNFAVLDENGERVLAGQAGTPVQLEMPQNEKMILAVNRLVARPGTEFVLSVRPIFETVRGIQFVLRAIERRVGSGIIELSMEGENPQDVARILNAVAQAHVERNIEFQAEEATNTLSFLNEQLPLVRTDLEAAEAKLRTYQVSKGSVNLTEESSQLLTKVAQAESDFQALEMTEAEMLQRYTESHPAMVSLRDKKKRIRDQIAELDRFLRTVPVKESEVLRLTRDVKVTELLYQQMLNKVQELKIVRSGVTGYVRVADPAYVPPGAIRPNRPQIVILTTFLFSILSIGFVLLMNAVFTTLRAPEQIEQRLSIPVYATVPHSGSQDRLDRMLRSSKTKSGDSLLLLARENPQDVAVEGLRSLRASLHFALGDTVSNVIALSGPTPELGKSFVVSNFAVILADTGKRVVLVDGDMRRGRLHRAFGAKRVPGLSEVLTGQIELEKALYSADGGNLFFLPSGSLPPNPAQLLMKEALGRTIAALSKQFDHVLIDTPPALSLADALLFGQLAGANFLVVRANKSTVHHLEAAIKRYRNSNIRLTGVIFNDLRASPVLYTYGYGNYKYKTLKNQA